MSSETERKYIKTKFEGVFSASPSSAIRALESTTKIYCFWYADHDGKGHWKTVGRHSKGIRPATPERSGQTSLPSLRPLASTPLSGIRSPSGTWWMPILNGTGAKGNTLTSKYYSQYNAHLKSKFTLCPLSS